MHLSAKYHFGHAAPAENMFRKSRAALQRSMFDRAKHQRSMALGMTVSLRQPCRLLNCDSLQLRLKLDLLSNKVSKLSDAGYEVGSVAMLDRHEPAIVE